MFGTARALAIAGPSAEDDGDGHSLRARLFLRLYGRDFGPEERGRIVDQLDRLEPYFTTTETSFPGT